MYICRQFLNRQGIVEIMAITRCLTIFFTPFLVLLIQNNSFSQVKESLFTSPDTLEVAFEKVILNGRVAYRNAKTNDFISYSDYNHLKRPYTAKTILVKKTIAYTPYSYDYWQTDKVNPYKEVILPTPFKVQFNQTTFTHPIAGDMVITSRYGRRLRGAHRGIDIDLITGDAVRSV